MLYETIIYKCTRCGSTDIIQSGYNASNNPNSFAKTAKQVGFLNPKFTTPKSKKELTLPTYQEQASMGAIQRLFGVSRPTLITWLKDRVNLTLCSRRG